MNLSTQNMGCFYLDNFQTFHSNFSQGRPFLMMESWWALSPIYTFVSGSWHIFLPCLIVLVGRELSERIIYDLWYHLCCPDNSLVMKSWLSSPLIFNFGHCSKKRSNQKSLIHLMDIWFYFFNFCLPAMNDTGHHYSVNF